MAPSRSPPSGVWRAAGLPRVALRPLQRVCEASGDPSPAPCRRRGPVGAAPDDVLVAHVRRVLEASPFHGEGYRKVWVKLRVEGRRTSKERVRRLMREHDLQAPQRAGHAHGPKAHDGTITTEAHDGTITTEAPDVMWGTDMTATVTVAEGPAFVFVAVDHCTAECIGLHAAKRGTRFEALEPIRQGIRDRFGGIGEGVARGLRLRHDHGSNYLADDFQQEVAFFGIAVISAEYLDFLKEKDVANLPGWYTHDLRVIVMALLANTTCGEEVASQLATLYDKINAAAH